MTRKRVNTNTRHAWQAIQNTPKAYDALMRLIFEGEYRDDYGNLESHVEPSWVYPAVADHLYSYNRCHMTYFERETVSRAMIGIDWPHILYLARCEYSTWRHKHLAVA